MTTLADAAFGSTPNQWPLPTACVDVELWHRAVAAGGQGRYASALTDLETLGRLPAVVGLTSLALSTRASFLRQLGDHVAARAWDGRAWAQAGDDADARADALIGLAADALGVGRFAASARLLRRAREIVSRGAVGGLAARIPVRLAWVSAELAMVTGEGAAAVAHAEHAVALAGETGSLRHAVKSEVVLAAALCCHGETAASRRVADAALGLSQGQGLVPLSWALSCLLADIGSGVNSPEDIDVIRDVSADTVRRRGGAWSVR
jgi:hypothetical protein